MGDEERDGGRRDGGQNGGDLGKVESRLRGGDVPEAWRAVLPDADSATFLLMIWNGRLARRVDAYYQSLLRPFDLTYPDYALLTILALVGPHTPKQLNRSLAITSGGLTKSIDRLEKARLATRSPDPADGRGTIVSITKAGGARAQELLQLDVASHSKHLGDMSVDSRQRIAAALRELLDALESGNE